MLLVRSYRARDQRAVCELLADLPRLYPGADRWLGRRLTDVLDGRARCLVADAGGELVGVVIETPKGMRLKVSTFFVADRWRRRGIGRVMLDAAAARWARERWREIYLTVADEAFVPMSGLMAPLGFQAAGVLPDKYGPGRHETILAVRPQRFVMSIAPRHAARIYDGLKGHEFRRAHANIPVGALVLIYETAPVGMVTGAFTVRSLVHGTPDEVVSAEPNAQSRADGLTYLAGARRACAVGIRGAHRFDVPVTLEQAAGLTRPPQSYQRLTS